MRHWGVPTTRPFSVYFVHSMTFKRTLGALGLSIVSRGSLYARPDDQSLPADSPVHGEKSNTFLPTIPSDRELQGGGSVLRECFSGILPANPYDRASLADNSIHRQAPNRDPTATRSDQDPPFQGSTRGRAYDRTPPTGPRNQRPRTGERNS